MNIAKIKEALADAVEAKEHAEADGNSDYAYWQGYEEGILMALWHIEGEALFQMEEKSK
jgi:dihydrodipicolinate synthase/N-acetylneuraminate lyase